MRIVFIHAGKTLYSKLSAHYHELIKESMHLIPIDASLNVNGKKYKSYESLPQGVIIGVALFDDGFWFNETYMKDPWYHGPYCFPIIDAIRLEAPIVCKGNQLLWKIPPRILNQALSMLTIQKKLNEWKNKYEKIMDIESSAYSALTIYQPFAEAIVRKLKTVENRSKRVLKVSANPPNEEEMNDAYMYGCRVCVMKKMYKNENKYQDILAISQMNYTKYGRKYIKELRLHNHEELPAVVENAGKIRYNHLNWEKCHCKRRYFPRRKRTTQKYDDSDNKQNDDYEDEDDTEEEDTTLRRSQRIKSKKNTKKQRLRAVEPSSESRPKHKYNLRTRKKKSATKP